MYNTDNFKLFFEKDFLDLTKLKLFNFNRFQKHNITFKNKNCVGTNKKGFVVNKMNGIYIII